MNISVLLICASILLQTSLGWAGIIFKEDFDNQPDWEPVSPSECFEGSCNTPQGWNSYRSTGLFNPSSSTKAHNTINISKENFRGPSDTNEPNKGLTIWTEASSETSWTSDGILATDLKQDYDELYFSFYIKFSPTWKWRADGDGLMKVARLLHFDGAGSVFDYFSTGNSGPITLWDVKNSINYGWRYYFTNRCDPQEQNYYCNKDASPAGFDWDQLFNSGKTFKESIGDGEWHHVMVYAKLNSRTGTSWNSDGINKVWIDGKLNGYKNNIQWLSLDTAKKGWNYFAIGGNQSNQFANISDGEEQWYAIDDITISTDFIPFINLPK